MTTDEKIRLVDSFDDIAELTSEHFDILKKFSKDEDAFLRSRCAALLINFVDDESMEILLRLCDDEDELVRTESYDSLSVFYDKKVEEKLFSKIGSETSEPAYGYALISWADVTSRLHESFEEQINFVHKELDENDGTDPAILDCYYALTVFGEDHVPDIIGYLKNDDINTGCVAVNLLKELMNDENKDMIVKSVLDLSETETVGSVKSAIQRILEP